MILDTDRNTSSRLVKTRLGFIISAAALFAVLTLYAAPRLVLAQNASAASAASSEATPTRVSADGASVAVSAPVALASADSEPPVPHGPAEVGPGPKFKLEPMPPNVPAPHAIPLPGPVAVPRTVIVAPMPPGAVHAVVQPGVPHPARVAHGRAENSSIEERLDRLERMVESLMARRDMKPGGFEFKMRGPDQKEWTLDRKRVQEIEESAKRQAQLADEQGKRAAKEAEKAMKLQEKRRHGKMASEQLHKQIEALQRQRESMEREMQRLERQIEKLEQDQEKQQEEQEEQVEQQENEEQADQDCDQNKELKLDKHNEDDNAAAEPA